MEINYNKVIEPIINNKIIKATYYINPKFIVRATRKLFDKKIVKGNIEISLTVGKPNYVERNFIRQCEKVKEPFPVKRVQLKEYKPKNSRLA